MTKPVIPARHAINWYYGNFLMRPGNALRDAENYCERVNKLIESLYVEYEGQFMTHKQFLDMMKDRGIHNEYYRYQKPKPTDCPICRFYGIR
jgi:hypothetical protein